MAERIRPADTRNIADELEQAREQREQRHWIEAHRREAAEGDLIEEASIVEEEDELALPE
jgi:hypothetical protein